MPSVCGCGALKVCQTDAPIIEARRSFSGGGADGPQARAGGSLDAGHPTRLVMKGLNRSAHKVTGEPSPG